MIANLVNRFRPQIKIDAEIHTQKISEIKVNDEVNAEIPQTCRIRPLETTGFIFVSLVSRN